VQLGILAQQVLPTGPYQPVIRPEVGSYTFNANIANNLFVHRLEDRIGASEYTNMNKDDVGQLWLRAVGGYNEFEDKSGQIDTDGHHYLLHAGLGLAKFGEKDEYNVGLMAAYGNAGVIPNHLLQIINHLQK
jgi:autotransporter family porin